MEFTYEKGRWPVAHWGAGCPCFYIGDLLLNHDRPVYKEGDTSGTSYEIGKVVGILEDNVTVDESTDGLWRGDMKLQVKILTGHTKVKLQK